MPPTPCPTNALAVHFNELSAIVYTDDKGYVSWLAYYGKEEKGSLPYALQNAVVANMKGSITACEGQLALVMFHTHNVQHEVNLRLYYIQKGEDIDTKKQDHTIRELSAVVNMETMKKEHNKEKRIVTTGIGWWRGDLNNSTISAFDQKNYVARADSPLAAVSDGCGGIKVYFRLANSDAMTVAYTSAKEKEKQPSKCIWEERVVSTAF